MAEAESTYCSNYGRHQGRKIRAVSRLSWPDGRFKPETACAGCLTDALWNARSLSADGGHPLLVSPITESEEARQYRESRRQRLEKSLGRAINDPGAITGRAVIHEEGWDGTPDYESVTAWQKRAVLQVIDEECRA